MDQFSATTLAAETLLLQQVDKLGNRYGLMLGRQHHCGRDAEKTVRQGIRAWRFVTHGFGRQFVDDHRFLKPAISTNIGAILPNSCQKESIPYDPLDLRYLEVSRITAA
jgi:hypothetical protein